MSGVMSTLNSMSEIIGKAMHLPDVFYKPLPLSSILDTPIELSRLTRMTKKKVRKKAKTTSCKAGDVRPAANTSLTLSGPLIEGSQTRFAVQGQDFQVCATTWIIGELRLGSVVRIRGALTESSILEATSIVIL